MCIISQGIQHTSTLQKAFSDKGNNVKETEKDNGSAGWGFSGSRPGQGMRRARVSHWHGLSPGRNQSFHSWTERGCKCRM